MDVFGGMTNHRAFDFPHVETILLTAREQLLLGIFTILLIPYRGSETTRHGILGRVSVDIA